MRLHALISWYDEPLDALGALLSSLPRAGVTSIVALDGAYRMFPGGRATSPPDQADRILRFGRLLNVDATVRVPPDTWDSEMAKRTALFALALGVSDPGDWWLVMDADTLVAGAPADLLGQLAATNLEAACVTVRAPTSLRLLDAQAVQHPWARTGHYAYRLLYRAQAIQVEGRHCVYATADGRYLWAPQGVGPEVPALNMPDLIVEHRDEQRPVERLTRRVAYYRNRDASGAEGGG